MERWLAVPGYEGIYEVSDEGQVRSIERSISQKSRTGAEYIRTMKGVLLTGVPGSDGRYLYVHLSNSHKQHHSIHSLVLRAFVGEPKEGQEGCHNDGDSHNNRLANLRWDTHEANELDRKAHGTVCKGETHASAHLTNDLVRQIKADLAAYSGKPYGMYSQISKKYGISPKRIGEIHRKRCWAHI